MNWYSYIFWLYSWVSVLPWVLIILHRFRYPANYDSFLKRYPVSSGLDLFIHFFVLPFVFYYICDSIQIMFIMPSISPCNWSYLLHHLIALVGARYMCFLPYYPWFILFPFGWHSLMIMFPGVSALNYGYLGTLGLMFMGLNTKPWNLYSIYRGYTYTGYVLVAIPLSMLWYNRCTNNMANVEV